jgi:hypothetical protein
MWKNIWHYHRKALLPGEISVPSAGRLGLRSIAAGMLGAFRLILLLLQSGTVFFRLDRANLRNPQIEGLREIVLYEKGQGAFVPDLLLGGYLIRGVLRGLIAPFIGAELKHLNRYLGQHGLAPVSLSTAAAAAGDRAFCRLLVYLKTRGGRNEGNKIYFCAAIVPDAHVYVCASGFVEVAHGVIHFGHPSLFNLDRTETAFIVPDARSMEICLENSKKATYIVNPQFFKTFFVKDEVGPRVFIGQPGDPFEAIATRFLRDFPEWSIRPHPRSSVRFVEMHRSQIFVGSNVAEVASISSTMLNDATQLVIPLTVVRSTLTEENEKLETSFEGLLLPAEYKLVHV